MSSVAAAALARLADPTPYTYTSRRVNLLAASGEVEWYSVPDAARDGLAAREHATTVTAVGDGNRAGLPARYRAACTCNGLRAPWRVGDADAAYADSAAHVCADRVADTLAAGGALVEVVSEVEYCASEQVIRRALDVARSKGDYRDGDDALIGLDVSRFLNMSADAGRPSDAARSVTRSYLADAARFRADFAASRANDSTVRYV